MNINVAVEGNLDRELLGHTLEALPELTNFTFRFFVAGNKQRLPIVAGSLSGVTPLLVIMNADSCDSETALQLKINLESQLNWLAPNQSYKVIVGDLTKGDKYTIARHKVIQEILAFARLLNPDRLSSARVVHDNNPFD